MFVNKISPCKKIFHQAADRLDIWDEVQWLPVNLWRTATSLTSKWHKSVYIYGE